MTRLPRLFASSLVVAAVAASAYACSSSDSNTGGDTSPTVTAAQTACSTDARKDVYDAGLTKPAGPLSVKLLDANPAPPAKGTNIFTVELSDASGAPVDGATITVVPLMPDHGHGSTVVPSVAPTGGGKYTVSNVYLVMAGLWQINFTIQVAGAPVQKAVFQFCLDG